MVDDHRACGPTQRAGTIHGGGGLAYATNGSVCGRGKVGGGVGERDGVEHHSAINERGPKAFIQVSARGTP